MKKILAINSGSSSFKFKLFTFPDEKVISEGLADRVGLEGSTFAMIQFYSTALNLITDSRRGTV